MANLRGEDFNKEKLAFLLSLPLLAASTYFCITTCPEELKVEGPITASLAPAPYQDPPETPTRLAVGQERKSPFTPMPWTLANTGKAGTPVAPNPNRITPPPPPTPAVTPVTPQAAETPAKPPEKELEVEYMGVISFHGQDYGLLRVRKDGSSRRVKEGDTIQNLRLADGELLEGLNYTIAAVDRQSILLLDDEGGYHTLTSNRGAPTATPEGTKAAPGGTPGFGPSGSGVPPAPKPGGKVAPPSGPAAPPAAKTPKDAPKSPGGKGGPPKPLRKDHPPRDKAAQDGGG